VVIGQYTGFAAPFGPFSVNTTIPSPGNPGGDCWQQGALSTALTPDLRPGDTVTVTGAGGALGGPPVSTTVTVAPDARASTGPINGCDSLAPFAQNIISDSPASVTGGPVTVAGRAQPLATDVSITATDGTNTTPAVPATPAADGTWSATIPAAAVDALADGPLTVTPVIAVPDVSTGAQAHIAAGPITVQKAGAGAAAAADAAAGLSTAGPADSAASTLTVAAGPAASAASAPAHGTVAGRVSGLRSPARLSVRSARGRGISVSFVAPPAASTVQVQLVRGGRVVDATAVAAHPGARQTVRLNSAKLRRLLRSGRYTLRVRAGASLKQLGAPLLRGVVLR
jgi:hypothetical protein